jgi:hypothetical protein
VIVSHHRRPYIFGWIIVIIGALLLLNHWFTIELDWTSVLMVIGIAFLVAGLLKRDHGTVFPGMLCLLLGLLFYLKANHVIWIPWGELWPVIILCIGVAFLIQFIVDPKRKGGLLPGLVLLAVGFLFLFTPFCWFDIIYWIGKLWPVLLILVGLYLIFKSEKGRRDAGNL